MLLALVLALAQLYGCLNTSVSEAWLYYLFFISSAYSKKLTDAGIHNEIYVSKGAVHAFYTLPGEHAANTYTKCYIDEMHKITIPLTHIFCEV